MLISSISDLHQNKAKTLDLSFRDCTHLLLNHAPPNATTPDAAWLSAFKISQENVVSQKRIPMSTTLIRKLMYMLSVCNIFVCYIGYLFWVAVFTLHENLTEELSLGLCYDSSARYLQNFQVNTRCALSKSHPLYPTSYYDIKLWPSNSMSTVIISVMQRRTITHVLCDLWNWYCFGRFKWNRSYWSHPKADTASKMESIMNHFTKLNNNKIMMNNLGLV